MSYRRTQPRAYREPGGDPLSFKGACAASAPDRLEGEFIILLTEHDIYLFREGSHGELYAKLGCHLLAGGGEAEGGGNAGGGGKVVLVILPPGEHRARRSLVSRQ